MTAVEIGLSQDMPSSSQRMESAERAEMQVLAKVAACGVPWRPGHVQYRNNMLRWYLYQTVISVRARHNTTILSDGSGHIQSPALSNVHLETSVRCVCQLSGTPVVSCTFRDAHGMKDGDFNECVSERRSASDGTMAVFTIPPDGDFELVHYSMNAKLQEACGLDGDAVGTTDAARDLEGPGLLALAQTRLPLEVCSYASERENGRLFSLHARLRIGQGFQQLRNIRCVLPLHPHCQPGSVHLHPSIGRAQVLDDDVTNIGGHSRLVIWELASVGQQTGYTQENERIECAYEAFLDVQCAISGPLILFPYHVITGEQNRPESVPAESLATDCNLWTIWNDIIGNLHRLDEMKKPFPRDRTSEKTQLRRQLEQLKQVAEHRLVASCLSRALPPVDVKIERVFGPCFTGLDVKECRVAETHYPGVPSSDGGSPPSILEPMSFAHGMVRHLSCAQLLFELHAADFRQEILPIAVPVVVLEGKHEIAEDDILVRRASSVAAVEQAPVAGTAPGESQTKSRPKKKGDAAIKTDSGTKKVPAKGGAAKGKATAAKGKK